MDEPFVHFSRVSISQALITWTSWAAGLHLIQASSLTVVVCLTFVVVWLVSGCGSQYPSAVHDFLRTPFQRRNLNVSDQVKHLLRIQQNSVCRQLSSIQPTIATPTEYDSILPTLPRANFGSPRDHLPGHANSLTLVQ